MMIRPPVLRIIALVFLDLLETMDLLMTFTNFLEVRAFGPLQPILQSTTTIALSIAVIGLIGIHLSLLQYVACPSLDTANARP